MLPSHGQPEIEKALCKGETVSHNRRTTVPPYGELTKKRAEWEKDLNVGTRVRARDGKRDGEEEP